MDINLSIKVFLDDESKSLLRAAVASLATLHVKVDHMANEIADLQAAVAAEDTVIDGAITLLQGILSRLDQATDLTQVAAIAADVRARTDALAAAVAAVPPAPVTP